MLTNIIEKKFKSFIEFYLFIYLARKIAGNKIQPIHSDIWQLF